MYIRIYIKTINKIYNIYKYNYNIHQPYFNKSILKNIARRLYIITFQIMAGIFVGGQSVFVLKPLRSESLVQVVLLEVLGGRRYFSPNKKKAAGEKSFLFA